MNCEHKLKMIRDSQIYYRGETIPVYVWQCQECEKYCFINIDTGKRVYLNGALGEEIE